MLFNRILVPLDGSVNSEAILGLTWRMLRRKSSEMILLRIVPFPNQVEFDTGLGTDHLRSEAEQYLSALSGDLAREGAVVRTLVVMGSESPKILEAAEREHVSLIAMTTHGRTGLSRFVFGSVAENVLRGSAAPVLLIRSFSDDRSRATRADLHERPIRRILAAVDGSPCSLACIPAVREMACEFGASVMLLTVTDSKHSGDDALIRAAMKTLVDAHLSVDPVVRLGDPTEEILDAAAHESIDLTVMATHGRSGVSRVAFGSVTEQVLRHSTTPMLVVRCPHAPREQAPVLEPVPELA